MDNKYLVRYTRISGGSETGEHLVVSAETIEIAAEILLYDECETDQFVYIDSYLPSAEVKHSDGDIIQVDSVLFLTADQYAVYCQLFSNH